MKNLKIIKTFFILFFLFFFGFTVTAQNTKISGKVIDSETNKPIAFTSVSADGTNIGTVTNTQGEFTIQFDNSLNVKSLSFKYIGYRNKTVKISSIPDKKFKVKMNPSLISIEEVVIRPNDPKELIKEVLRKIPANYSDKANKEMAFYREYVKNKRKFVSISEAVVEIYKAPYNKELSEDVVKLFKGHKSANVKAQDTVIMKLRGGPKTALLLDIAKNPYILFSDEKLEDYDFSLTDVTNINNQQNYIIIFKQKANQEHPLFNGKIYVNIKNLAITAAEFNLNLENISEASKVFIRKKPLFMTVRPTNTKYLVNYVESNGKYYFSHARGEVEFDVKWKKRLFKSHYSVMTEIAITDRTDKNVVKIPKNEQLKAGIVFDEKVYPFTDSDFWGKYNTIKPEESIQRTIKRYGVKLKIQDN